MPKSSPLPISQQHSSVNNSGVSSLSRQLNFIVKLFTFTLAAIAVLRRSLNPFTAFFTASSRTMERNATFQHQAPLRYKGSILTFVRTNGPSVY